MRKIIKPGWYVLYVRFKHEKKIEKVLILNGIDVFLPLQKTVSQWKDRKKKIFKPLFPCYIFVNVKSKSEFHRALTIDGVITPLSLNNEPARIKPSEISDIKGFLGIEQTSNIEFKKVPANIGESAQIQHGPLKGMNCVIEKIKDCYNICVIVKSIRFQISATLPISYLELAPSNK